MHQSLLTATNTKIVLNTTTATIAFYTIICNTLPAGWAFPVIVPVSRLYRDGPYESHFDLDTYNTP